MREYDPKKCKHLPEMGFPIAEVSKHGVREKTASPCGFGSSRVIPLIPRARFSEDAPIPFTAFDNISLGNRLSLDFEMPATSYARKAQGSGFSRFFLR